MIDPDYLPFPAEVVRNYFGYRAAEETLSTAERRLLDAACEEALKNVAAFEASAGRRRNAQGAVRSGRPLKELSFAHQIEKDETFWTAATWIGVFESGRQRELLGKLLRRAFEGRDPMPFGGELASWESCLDGRLSLRLEAVHPAPDRYKAWLRNQFETSGEFRHLVPHVVDSVRPGPEGGEWKQHLEGGTHVDALIVNEDNGFGVAIEAKVLSDISPYVTYDMRRNQMARILDVMMDDAGSAAMRYAGLERMFRTRRSDRTLFLLQTPRVFQSPGRSRLYWYKFREYADSDAAIQADLPHRTPEECRGWSKRIGWLTWEDCSEASPVLCRWLRGTTDPC